jgi:hypothetical protein
VRKKETCLACFIQSDAPASSIAFRKTDIWVAVFLYAPLTLTVVQGRCGSDAQVITGSGLGG